MGLELGSEGHKEVYQTQDVFCLRDADWLNVLDAKLSNIYYFNFRMFAEIGSNGSVSGLVGGGFLFVSLFFTTET